MKIHLDDTSPLPKYQQIVEQLCSMIRNGELGGGEKLPPERELGKENQIARGTVQMAYQELIKQGYAYAVRGSGTYILKFADSGREEALAEELNRIFDRAEQMGLQERAVVDIFRKLLVRRTVGDVKMLTAWVDCCPEALQLAKNEFRNIENNKIEHFLIETVRNDPQLLQNDFDMIVTTTHHYETFMQLFPELLNKVFVVSIVTSNETLIELAKISPETRVVVWTISKIFMENLMWHMRDLDNIHVARTFISDKARDEIEECLKTTDLLITSREYWDLGEPAMLNLIEKYKEEGGRVIYFEYVFDPGSLLHLQTHICEKIAEKEKKML